ncbi:unnamed protein product [Cochlearia groenlandica]
MSFCRSSEASVGSAMYLIHEQVARKQNMVVGRGAKIEVESGRLNSYGTACQEAQKRLEVNTLALRVEVNIDASQGDLLNELLQFVSFCLVIISYSVHETADVVGCIKSVNGYGLTDPNVFAPILIHLLIAPDVEVDLALVDDAAAKFKGLLNSRESAHSVMLITSLIGVVLMCSMYSRRTNSCHVRAPFTVYGISA